MNLYKWDYCLKFVIQLCEQMRMELTLQVEKYFR